MYGVVSDSNDGLSSSCPDNQPSSAMPYEVAVFHGQSRYASGDIHQFTEIDSKSDLKPCDERDVDVHNPQDRENESILIHRIDEHHLYDEVKHKEKNCSKVSEINES